MWNFTRFDVGMYVAIWSSCMSCPSRELMAQCTQCVCVNDIKVIT